MPPLQDRNWTSFVGARPSQRNPRRKRPKPNLRRKGCNKKGKKNKKNKIKKGKKKVTTTTATASG
jgi:hypothetical protein